MLPWTFQFQALHREIFGLLSDKSSSWNFRGFWKTCSLHSSAAGVFSWVSLEQEQDSPPLYIGISFACPHLPYDLPDGDAPKKAQQEEVNSSAAPSSTPLCCEATLSTIHHGTPICSWPVATSYSLSVSKPNPFKNLKQIEYYLQTKSSLVWQIILSTLELKESQTNSRLVWGKKCWYFRSQ